MIVNYDRKTFIVQATDVSDSCCQKSYIYGRKMGGAATLPPNNITPIAAFALAKFMETL
jgi:hypothetical protein